MTSPEALEAYEKAVNRESAAYRALLAAMKQHEMSLTSHDPEEIKLSIQENLECLETARQAGATRREMETGIADDAAQPLREKLMELGKLSREIRHRNARNRRIVEHSLDLLRGDFKALDEMIQGAMGRSPEERAGGSLVSLRA